MKKSNWRTIISIVLVLMLVLGSFAISFAQRPGNAPEHSNAGGSPRSHQVRQNDSGNTESSSGSSSGDSSNNNAGGSDQSQNARQNGTDNPTTNSDTENGNEGESENNSSAGSSTQNSNDRGNNTLDRDSSQQTGNGGDDTILIDGISVPFGAAARQLTDGEIKIDNVKENESFETDFVIPADILNNKYEFKTNGDLKNGGQPVGDSAGTLNVILEEGSNFTWTFESTTHKIIRIDVKGGPHGYKIYNEPSDKDTYYGPDHHQGSDKGTHGISHIIFRFGDLNDSSSETGTISGTKRILEAENFNDKDNFEADSWKNGEGWTIELYKVNGSETDFVRDTETDEDGTYKFDDLDLEKDYIVKEGEVPEGWKLVKPTNNIHEVTFDDNGKAENLDFYNVELPYINIIKEILPEETNNDTEFTVTLTAGEFSREVTIIQGDNIFYYDETEMPFGIYTIEEQQESGWKAPLYPEGQTVYFGECEPNGVALAVAVPEYCNLTPEIRIVNEEETEEDEESGEEETDEEETDEEEPEEETEEAVTPPTTTGGGLTGTFSVPQIIEMDDPIVPAGAPEPEIVIPDPVIPEGAPEEPIVLDEEPPLGVPELPQTGEGNPLYFYLAGILLAGTGLAIRRTGKTARTL